MSKKNLSRANPNPSQIQQLRQISRLLDEAIAIPGTRIRFGLDPILGLIPGGGDTVGLLMSAVIVMQAARLGASKSVLTQMAFNIILETVVGTVPVVGDVFDVAWKSNVKNLKLLEDYLHLPHPARPRNQGYAILLLVAIVLVFIAAIAVSVLLVRWLVGLWN